MSLSIRTALVCIHATLMLAGCQLVAPPATPQCTSNGDCAEGFICKSQVCVGTTKGGCGDRQACSYDTECSSRSCKDGCCLPSCTSDSECDITELCIENVCRVSESTSCESDGDCPLPGAPHCDLLSGVCARCTEDAHCEQGFICQNFGCKEEPKEGCTEDADCPLITPRCLKEEQKCVVCLVDGHCSRDGTAVCDPNTHVCQAVKTGCDVDFDCNSVPATPHCRTSDRTCVQCVSSDQCGSSGRCISDYTCGTSLTCASVKDCSAPTKICDVAARTCVECTGNSDCGPAKSCIKGACVLTGCFTDANCMAPTPRCQRSSYSCVQCLLNSDCPAGNTCVNNVCKGCSTNADCAGVPGMSVCNVSKKQCVQCLSVFDGNCKSPLICDTSLQLCTGCGSDFECQYIHKLQPVCDGTVDACVQCEKDSDCVGGKKCQSHICW